MAQEETSPNTVEQAALMLRDLPVNPRKGRRGALRDAIEELRPHLEEAHDRKGYTWEELCEHLKNAGIEISVHTLKAYMRKPKEDGAQATAHPQDSPQDAQDNQQRTDGISSTHLPTTQQSTKDQFTVR